MRTDCMLTAEPEALEAETLTYQSSVAAVCRECRNISFRCFFRWAPHPVLTRAGETDLCTPRQSNIQVTCHPSPPNSSNRVTSLTTPHPALGIPVLPSQHGCQKY